MLNSEERKIISFEESLFKSNDVYAEKFERLPASESIVPIITDEFGKLTTSSAVLIKYRDKILLLTAFHCIDESSNCDRRVNFFDGGIGELSNIDWCFRKDFDFAFACLDDADAKSIIEKKQYFELPSFEDVSKISGDGRQYFLAVGYPLSKNKKIKRKKKIKRAKIFLEEVKQNNSGNEFFCKFEKDNFYLPDKRKIEKIFDPIGMSGGALIHINTVYDAAIELEPTFILSGLNTKYKKNNELFIATNILVIKNVIEGYFRGQ